MSTNFGLIRVRLAWTLLLLAFALLVQGLAIAADSVGVSYTLEGCRNDGTITLPNGSGDFRLINGGDRLRLVGQAVRAIRC